MKRPVYDVLPSDV